MVKDLKKLFEAKRYQADPKKQQVLKVMNGYFGELTEQNILLEKGAIRLVDIPSPLRMNISLKKYLIITELKKQGIIVRDIL
jgi:hypothetical protein